MSKNQTKGFTLIELLAVIVILAVVALVATPIILASVSNAKKSAANSSTLGYIDAVNKYIGLNDVDPDNYPYTLQNGVYYVSGTDTSKTYLNDIIKVTGNKPESGWVLVQDRRVVQYSFKMDEYIVSETITTNEQTEEDTSTKTVVKATGDNASPVAIPEGATEQTLESSSSNQVASGPTSENAPAGFSGVLKVVYLDPTDLTRECNNSAYNETTNPNGYVSTTNTKSGCMRWYAYAETSTEYKMILDHNTTARLAFSSTSANTSTMVSEINARLAYDTSAWDIDDSDTSKIKSVSVITGDEIAVITGKTNATTTWDSTSISNYFYFDGLGTSKTVTYSSTSRNPYAWLYNNTYGCKDDSTDYGCTEKDNTSYAGVKKSGTSWTDTGSGSMYGYWTSTPAGSSSDVWIVNRNGSLRSSSASRTGNGVRPVITVSKSLVP